MKRKEIKQLAEKIAKCEYTAQHSTDAQEIQAALEEIMKLSSRVHNLADLDQVDEMVQDILAQMS